MLTRRRYNDDAAVFEEIVKGQMDRSAGDAHNGFRQFVLSAVQREFASHQDKGELAQYLKQIPIIQSMQTKIVNNLADPETIKKWLDNMDINPGQVRSNGSIQIYITENMEVIATAEKLPILKSVVVSEDRIKMYEELLKTGVSVDQLLAMFYAGVYLSLPTHENIQSWMDLIARLDINTLKDPLTQLSELHEAGVDFTTDHKPATRDTELLIISDMATLILTLVSETKVYTRARDIQILLFLTRVNRLSALIDQLETTDKILRQKSETNLTKIVKDMQYKLDVDLTNITQIPALSRKTVLKPAEKIHTYSPNFMENWCLRAAVDIFDGFFRISYVVGLCAAAPPRQVRYSQYSWHRRFIFQTEPKQNIQGSVFHIRTAENLLLNVETNPDKLDKDFETLGAEILQDENLYDSSSIVGKFTNTSHVPPGLKELYQATLVSGDGKDYLLGLCPLHLDQPWINDTCLLCQFPTLTTDIISYIFENKQGLDSLKGFHGTDQGKNKLLCKHLEVPSFCVKCVLQQAIMDNRDNHEKCSQTKLPCWTHKKLCKQTSCCILEQISQTIVTIATKTDRIRSNPTLNLACTMTIEMMSYLHLLRVAKPRNMEIRSIIFHEAMPTTRFDFMGWLQTSGDKNPSRRQTVDQQIQDIPAIMKLLQGYHNTEEVTKTTSTQQVVGPTPFGKVHKLPQTNDTVAEKMELIVNLLKTILSDKDQVSTILSGDNACSTSSRDSHTVPDIDSEKGVGEYNYTQPNKTSRAQGLVQYSSGEEEMEVFKNGLVSQGRYERTFEPKLTSTQNPRLTKLNVRYNGNPVNYRQDGTRDQYQELPNDQQSINQTHREENKQSGRPRSQLERGGEEPTRQVESRQGHQKRHGYKMNVFFQDPDIQDQIPDHGVPEYVVLRQTLDPETVRNINDVDHGLEQIADWKERAHASINYRCWNEPCYADDIYFINSTANQANKLWRDYTSKSRDTIKASIQPEFKTTLAYCPEPCDLLSTFPLHFANRDTALRESHFNRLSSLNVDIINSTIEQGYKIYTFLCNATTVKNQFSELSQRNLVSLILDRLKDSTLPRQITEMLSVRFMELDYNENLYCYYVYKFLEDNYCETLRNSSTVQKLMDRERMEGRTVTSYIEALRPLCRLHVQSMTSDLVTQNRLLETQLKDKLISYLPLRSLSILQGVVGDPTFKSTSVARLTQELKRIDQVYDRRRQEVEDVNYYKTSDFQTPTDEIDFIEQEDESELEPLDICVFRTKVNGQRVQINPQLANTTEGACYKCNDTNHVSLSPNCPYVNQPFTMTPCNNCRHGLHLTSNCVKREKVAKTIAMVNFQRNSGTKTVLENKPWSNRTEPPGAHKVVKFRQQRFSGMNKPNGDTGSSRPKNNGDTGTYRVKSNGDTGSYRPKPNGDYMGSYRPKPNGEYTGSYKPKPQSNTTGNELNQNKKIANINVVYLDSVEQEPEYSLEDGEQEDHNPEEDEEIVDLLHFLEDPDFLEDGDGGTEAR